MGARLLTTTARMGLLAACLAGQPAHAREPDICKTWSDARTAGWIEKFNLKSASDIKSKVESKYKGKVIDFRLCPKGDSIVYRLTVYQADGNVLFPEEPAQ